MADPVDEPRPARLEVDGERLRLWGVLDLYTVAAVLEAGRRAIAQAPGTRVTLDLSGVDRSDSAGLALVVDWLRAARGRGLAMSIEGPPAQLADIARVSGLDELVSGGDERAA